MNHPGYPTPECQLLLKAALSPLQVAQKGWREWSEKRDIDDASWAEVRLIGAVAKRMGELDPGSSLTPKLEGISRFIWTRNQIRLRELVPALDLLEGLRVMLIKGGGRHASDPTCVAVRFVRDLDVYVHPEDLAEAVRRLLARGFRPTNGKLPGFVRSSDFDHPETGLELDVHAAILRHGRSTTHDEALWERAKEVDFRGREVWIADPTDQLLVSLCHGMIADLDSPADWALDGAHLLPQVDWDLLDRECTRRGLHAPVGAALAFMRQELRLDVPRWRNAPWLYRREFLADVKPRNKRSLLDRSCAFAAEIWRGRGCRREQVTPSMGYLGRPCFSGGGNPVSQFPAEFEVEPGSCVLTLVLDAPPKTRHCFDVYLNDQWIARLRIRPLAPTRFWRFRIPAADGGVLRITK